MSERRGIPARMGISALNFMAPGLGLLRIGRIPAAALFLPLLPAVQVLLLGYYALTPQMTFTGYVICVAALAFTLVIALVGSIFFAWRSSAIREDRVPWWSRWFALIAAFLALGLVVSALTSAMHRFYKPFYLPAEAMAPTLLKNDRLLASMRGSGNIKRGDVVLFDTDNGIYIKRVAGLPGDRISISEGTVIINDVPVEQKLVAREAVHSIPGSGSASRMAERFPGEGGSHHIYDLEPGQFDQMPEQRVADGHIFVLGDNRDRSADSRVPKELFGVEQVPLSAVRGHALFVTWSSDRSKIGRPVT